MGPWIEIYVYVKEAHGPPRERPMVVLVPGQLTHTSALRGPDGTSYAEGMLQIPRHMTLSSLASVAVRCFHAR